MSILKFIRRSLVILLILGALLVLGLRMYMARSLPQTDGQISLSAPGLTHTVDIIRDEFGIPHIYAKTDADMLFALGYVHAQDRLYQMEFQRRIAAGRLAALWGGGLDGFPANADRYLRTLGFQNLAEQTWDDPETLNAQARADLSAYAMGVNAFMGEGNPLPPEFTIAGIIGGNAALDGPWREANTLAWLKMMSLDLGSNMNRELARLNLASVMEEEKISAFFDTYPGADPFVLPDLNALYGIPMPELAGGFALNAGDTAVTPPPAGIGSNNWVIDGSLMADGASVLANDPHLGLGIPAIWYFAHISSEESGTNAIGATFPGSPFIVIGRNDHIAWGFTNTGPDVQDTFVERISPATGLYETPTGWEEVMEREEVIEVAGMDAPITLTVRTTRHGPLISDRLTVPAVFPQDTVHEYAFALQWPTTMASVPDTTANAAAKIFRATSYDDFREAARDYIAPQQNMVVLENDGTIGYIAPGVVPVRSAENLIEGWAPSPGWDATYDWQGFIAYEDLPQVYDPERGYVITANSDITPEGYGPYITRDWSLPLRHDRIAELTVGQERPLTMADMEAAIHDNRINSAAKILPTMIAATDLSSLSGDDLEAAETMMAALETWASEDGYSGDGELIGPTLFFTWYRDFVYSAVEDDFGFALTADNRTRITGSLYRFNPEFGEDLADGTAANWCDGGDCGAELAAALVSAHAQLNEELGGRMRSWRWARLHAAVSSHSLDGQIPLPNGLIKFLTGQSFRITRPHGGGPYSVNVSGFPINDTLDFNANHTASLRMLVAAGKFEEARFVHTQGQSGLPQSRHFSDMADLWAANEFAPMITDRSAVEAVATGTLRLIPAGE